MNIVLGFLFSFIIGYGGYRKGSLSLDGCISAIVLGTLIFYFGGFYLAALMVAFFISSSMLTKYKKDLKKVAEQLHQKGGTRTTTQVIANGGLGLLYSFLFFITNNHLFILAYITAFAAANADTWASEVGVLSKKDPISILTLRPIKKGMSGGISLLGTVVSFAGSLFISLLAWIGYLYIYGPSTKLLSILVISSTAGFVGSIIDSILGATIQAKYKCIVCGEVTERKIHHQKPGQIIGGFSIVNNDMVNFLSGLLASIIAITIYLLIP